MVTVHSLGRRALPRTRLPRYWKQGIPLLEKLLSGAGTNDHTVRLAVETVEERKRARLEQRALARN